MEDFRQIVLKILKFNDPLSINTQDNMVTDIIHKQLEARMLLDTIAKNDCHTQKNPSDLQSVNITLEKGNHAVNKPAKSDKLQMFQK